MKACPGCARNIADILGQCPFCRHIFEATEGGKPVLDPELISAALAADRSARSGPGGGLLQAGLLGLALPLLVPTLIVLFLGARRWGRVDWLALAVSGFVLTAFSFSSTLFFVLMLVADVAALALFILRYSRLDHGIFLGYSNAVASCLILGGLLLGGGIHATVPFGKLNALANLFGSETSLTRTVLAGHDLPEGPCAVTLDASAVEPDGGWLAVPRGTGWSFRRHTSTRVQPIVDAKSLWERHEDLAGSWVALFNVAAQHTFLRAGAELELTPGAPAPDPETRVHGVVAGTAGRVFLASEPVAPADAAAATAALKTPADRTGRLVLARADAGMAQAWTALKPGYNLPESYVLIVPGQPGAAENAPAASHAYVPVRGADGRAWLHFPQGLPVPLEDPIHGILLPDRPAPPFVEFLRHRPDANSRDVRVIEVVPRGAYARQAGLLGDGMSPGGLVALALGGLFAAFGVLVATRE